METDFRGYERRPSAHWLDDGIVELTMGVKLLVFGGLVLFGQHLPRTPAIWIPFWIVVPLGITALSLLQRRIVRALKARITAPRTGHIEPREPSKTWRAISLLIALPFGALILYSIVSGKGPSIDILGFAGPIVVGLPLALLGTQRKRLLIPAGVSLVFALVARQRGLGYEWFLLNIVVVGFVLGLMGLLTLRGYIKAHPAPQIPE